MFQSMFTWLCFLDCDEAKNHITGQPEKTEGKKEARGNEEEKKRAKEEQRQGKKGNFQRHTCNGLFLPSRCHLLKFHSLLVALSAMNLWIE